MTGEDIFHRPNANFFATAMSHHTTKEEDSETTAIRSLLYCRKETEIEIDRKKGKDEDEGKDKDEG